MHFKNKEWQFNIKLIYYYSGKPGGLGGLTGAQSVSFRQGSNVEFGAVAHERMVRYRLTCKNINVKIFNLLKLINNMFIKGTPRC